MNFSFNNQRKFHFGQPIMRQLSTCIVATATSEHSFLKPDYFLNKIPNDLIRNFSSTVISKKSFSNPNFVNKQHPNILTPSVAGTIAFDYNAPAPNFQEVKQNVHHLQQPKINNCEKNPEEYKSNEIETQKAPSQNNSEISEIEMPIVFSKSEQQGTVAVTKLEMISPKICKKLRKKRKKRKNAKRAKQDSNLEQVVKQKLIIKRSNSVMLSPKKIKKDSEYKMHNRKNKKYKPWHKISFEMEIAECNEPSVFTPESPKDLSIDKTDYAILKSQPVDINKSPICMAISPCKEFLKSFSSLNTSDISTVSPTSPVISRLRIPSECDSEDSFIVFCENAHSCDVSSDEESCSDIDSEVDCIFDVDFNDKTDLDKDTAKKKVSFKRDSELCEIHPMIKWNFAYHNARVGPWEQLARDRMRFETRIQRTGEILSSILCKEHRDRIYQERYENLN